MSTPHRLLILSAILTTMALLPQSAAAQAQMDSVRITFTHHTRVTVEGGFTNCFSEYVGSHPDPVGNGRDSDYIYKFNTSSVIADGYAGPTPSTWTGDHLDIAGERITFWGSSSSSSTPTWLFSGCDIFASHAAFWANLPAAQEAWAHYARPANKPPVALFTHMATDEMLTVRFDASGSHDEDGEVVSYSWDFGGDGSGAQGPLTSFKFGKRGTYEVSLTVADDDGANSDPSTQSVDVEGPSIRFVLSLERHSRIVNKLAEDPASVNVGDTVLVKIEVTNNGDLPLEQVALSGGSGAIRVTADGEDVLEFIRAENQSVDRLEPGAQGVLEFLFKARHESEEATVSISKIDARAVLPAGGTEPYSESDETCEPGGSVGEDESSGCALIEIAPAPLVVNSTGDEDLDDGLEPEDGCSTGGSIVRDGRTEPECTLRAALRLAADRESALMQEIKFDIPGGAAVHRITVEGSPWPAVPGPVSILGGSQPDGSLVQIDGGPMQGGGAGLELGSGDHAAVVEKLAFYGFPGTVLALHGRGSRVTGSLFGSDWDRSYASTEPSVSDPMRNGGTAVLVTGDRTTVGGFAGEGNLIVGSQHGVRVEGAWNVTVSGNQIGVLESPHTENGVELTGARSAVIGTSDAPNTISYNLGYGVLVDAASPEFAIQGNEMVRNRKDGIKVTQSTGTPEGSYIGGAEAGQGNAIERSIGAGIRVVGPSSSGAGEPLLSIQGNRTKGNEEIGIALEGGSRVLVGGPTGTPGSGAGNDIEDGVRLASGYASWVQGNRIANVDPVTGYSESTDVINVKGIRNVIGGETPGEGNVIYGVPNPDPDTGSSDDPGADASGFGITDEGSETLIQNNKIGNDDGAMPLYTGVVLRGNQARVLDNVISGNAHAGISARTVATIQGNRIGTTATGGGALGNGGPGVELWVGMLVGGMKEGEGCENPCNVISGNGGPGILVRREATGTVIQGNMIGVGADGLTLVGNGESGIVALADGVVIGGVNDVELLNCLGPCNTIAGNAGDGIRNFEAEKYTNLGSTGGATTQGTGAQGASGFVIEGNFIGTARGTPGSGNAGHGIALGGGGSNHRVGGTSVGRGNLIAGNGRAGVVVMASTESNVLRGQQWVGGKGNSIRGNIIHSNGTLAIDLYPNYIVPGGDGWNTLDAEDRSHGPNAMVNWPYLMESRGAGAGVFSDLLVLWTGPANASPQAYTLDVYTSAGCDGPMGSARNYLVSRTLNFPTGRAVDTVRVDVPFVASMPYYSATLTDAQGNTSELGNCRLSGQRPARANGNLSPDVRTEINNILFTLHTIVPKDGVSKIHSSIDLMVLSYEQIEDVGMFEETAASTSGGQPVLPKSLVGAYWEILAPSGPSGFLYDVCLPADGLEAPENLLVLGRGASTNGAWRPYRTRLETVGGLAYACADGVSAQQLSLGSGTESAIAVPVLTSPADNAAEVVLGAAFSWGSVQGAARYELQVALDAQFATLVFESGGLEGASAVPTSMANNQRHFWRVRAVGQTGAKGPWSVPFRFSSANTSVGLGEGPGLPEDFVLEPNYPNPFNPRTTIAFQLPQAGQVRLTVYDVLGRPVANLVNGPMPAGRHEVGFDAARLASGVYLYRLDAAGVRLTRQMLLLK